MSAPLWLMWMVLLLGGMVLENARQRLQRAMAERRRLYGPLGRQLLGRLIRRWPAPYRGWAWVSSRGWMWTHRHRIRSFESGFAPTIDPPRGLPLPWGRINTPEQALAFRARHSHNQSPPTAIVRLLQIAPDEPTE